MDLRVMIVEDDEIIREGLELALRQEGCQVYPAGTVYEAVEIIRRERPVDFYLLDILLPDGDGFMICQEIRKRSDTPILFLTACDDEVNTVRALEQGADDYISKPFRIRELLARMKAILRRTNREEGSLQKVAELGKTRVHLQTGRVYCGDEEIILTAMEYRLLLIFLNHRGQTLTRRQILNQIWDEAGDYVNDNTLSVYVKRLRRKLGDTAEGEFIQTVRGVGYRMEK